MKRNDIWQLRLYWNNETRLSVAKEGLVLDFFQNLLQAGGGEILTIVLYRANNVVRK